MTADSTAGRRLTIHGRAALSFRQDGAVTRLGTVFHSDPLRLLFPTPAAGDPPTGVVVTTSGGLVGGDRLELDVTAGQGASALVTMQAAEKVYRSAGPDVRVDVRLRVEPGADLEWLPQETILFDGARLRRTTAVDVAEGGRLLAGELLVFGRTARGERFTRGLARDAWEVRLAGRLGWADALHLEGDALAAIDHPAGFGGAVAYGTIIYVGKDAADRVGMARDGLPDRGCRAAATCVGPVLVVRFLGADAQALRAGFGAFWAAFRSRVLGRPERLPRLWHV